MHVKDMLPWNWGKRNVPVRRDGRLAEARDTDMNARASGFPELVEQFFRGALAPAASRFDLAGGAFLPALDASETDDEIRITLELPGMSEKDVEISLDDETLTIRGEKKEELERDERGSHWIERRFGSFQRSIPLPCEVDEECARASFNRGVLTVVLPKSETERSTPRSIPVQSD
jgi:HSP20 family protein